MSSTSSTKSTKQANAGQTFEVGGFIDQLKAQNERMMAETEKSVTKMMTFNQRIVEESQKAMSAQLEMQREWMNTMLGAARNIGAEQ